jgi:hypothetical protein
MCLNLGILGFLHPFSTGFMHIHPFCGSIEDHEEKDTDKSIIWAKWVYIMVEKGMLFTYIAQLTSLLRGGSWWTLPF